MSYPIISIYSSAVLFFKFPQDLLTNFKIKNLQLRNFHHHHVLYDYELFLYHQRCWASLLLKVQKNFSSFVAYVLGVHEKNHCWKHIYNHVRISVGISINSRQLNTTKNYWANRLVTETKQKFRRIELSHKDPIFMNTIYRQQNYLIKIQCMNTKTDQFVIHYITCI